MFSLIRRTAGFDSPVVDRSLERLWAPLGMSTIKLSSGMKYEVAHEFGPGRVLVNYEGLFVLVDRDPQTGEWDLSGEPARPDEKPVIEALIEPMRDKSILVVKKDEE